MAVRGVGESGCLPKKMPHFPPKLVLTTPVLQEGSSEGRALTCSGTKVGPLGVTATDTTLGAQ